MPTAHSGNIDLDFMPLIMTFQSSWQDPVQTQEIRQAQVKLHDL